MFEKTEDNENKEGLVLTRRVKIESDGMQLEGNIFYPPKSESKSAAILFIPGWGSKQNPELAESFSKDGFVCLTVDLRGHGETPGNRQDFARKDFVGDTAAAYDFLAKNERVDASKITLFGTSFGAYLSTILSSKREVSNLILRAPANYPDEGFDKPGLPTSDQPDIMDWRRKVLDSNSTISLKSINQFSGKVLIVESGQDEQVPFQTIENYLNAVKNQENVDHMVITNASHSISKNEDLKRKFKKMTEDWLRENDSK